MPTLASETSTITLATTKITTTAPEDPICQGQPTKPPVIEDTNLGTEVDFVEQTTLAPESTTIEETTAVPEASTPPPTEPLTTEPSTTQPPTTQLPITQLPIIQFPITELLIPQLPITQPPSPTIECKINSSAILYPDSENCGKFFMCVQGNLMPFNCRNGLSFSSEKQVLKFHSG